MSVWIMRQLRKILANPRLLLIAIATGVIITLTLRQYTGRAGLSANIDENRSDADIELNVGLKPRRSRHRITILGHVIDPYVRPAVSQKPGTDASCKGELEEDGRFSIVGYNHAEPPNCKVAACQLNRDRIPSKVYAKPVKPVLSLNDSVTVVIKTAHRLNLTMRLIGTIRKFYPSLKIIVVDDQLPDLLSVGETTRKDEARWRKYVRSSGDLIYYFRMPGDIGISRGRNAGLSQVQTKYFLLLDDDFIFTRETNIMRMKEILDRSDITVVGGFLNDKYGLREPAINGIFRVHQVEGQEDGLLHEYPYLAYEPVRCFPKCYVVDFVFNFFLARTEQIIHAGGWDNQLMVGEHRDFLLRLRKYGYKLAVCDDIIIVHDPLNLDLRKKAIHLIREKYRPMVVKKWSLDSMIKCNTKVEYLTFKCKSDE